MSAIFKLKCKDKKVKEFIIDYTKTYKKYIQELKKSCESLSSQYPYNIINKHGGLDNWEIIVIEESPLQVNSDAMNTKLAMLEDKEKIIILKETLNELKEKHPNNEIVNVLSDIIITQYDEIRKIRTVLYALEDSLL